MGNNQIRQQPTDESSAKSSFVRNLKIKEIKAKIDNKKVQLDESDKIVLKFKTPNFRFVGIFFALLSFFC